MNCSFKSLDIKSNIATYNSLAKIQPTKQEEKIALRSLGTDQKDIFVRTLSENLGEHNSDSDIISKKILEIFSGGDVNEIVSSLKTLLPDDSAMKKTSIGTAIISKGWKKPVVFPTVGDFRWLGWADTPSKLSTDEIWSSAYGEKPAAIVGAVGNSNIKPEQVRGGCSMSKAELSSLYEETVEEFWEPIFEYFIYDLGATGEDIGFAFAHSDSGVDKASRETVEAYGLKSVATTPTKYTKYVRGTECPPTEEFPNGYILADFPFPTVLTRNINQIEDYVNVYGKLVGKDNPLGVFGGGDHAFAKDIKESLVGYDGSYTIPVDILKDKHGIVIDAVDENGNTRNAARKALERINGNPYEQFKYAARNWLPSSSKKEDIMQYDPQMAIATIMYTNLAKQGKVDI